MPSKSVEILIKPVSMRCNLSCDYCFYVDECNNRETVDKGVMSRETAILLIKRALELPVDEICFTFQGGEPTLAGLDFFRFYVDEAKKLNHELKISADSEVYNHNTECTENTKKLTKESGEKNLLWSIQTNGTLLNEEWAVFFKENNFLVGISLDGPEEIHNKHRGNASYKKVISGLNILKNAGIVPNVLCVVTNNSNAKECYEQFKSLELNVQQYIPCLESVSLAEQSLLSNTREHTNTDGVENDIQKSILKNGNKTNPFLSASHFGDFLCKLYDLWIKDLKDGKQISIRYFENLAFILSGSEAESCNYCGGCKLQFVTEANGDVYPCDFYCVDEYLLGNIKYSDYIEMAGSGAAMEFTKIRTAADYDSECKACSFFKLCRAGCRREFMGSTHTQFCEAYKQLFQHIKNSK